MKYSVLEGEKPLNIKAIPCENCITLPICISQISHIDSFRDFRSNNIYINMEFEKILAKRCSKFLEFCTEIGKHGKTSVHIIRMSNVIAIINYMRKVAFDGKNTKRENSM